MLPHNTMLQRGQSRPILSLGHCGELGRELHKALRRLGSVGTHIMSGGSAPELYCDQGTD